MVFCFVLCLSCALSVFCAFFLSLSFPFFVLFFSLFRPEGLEPFGKLLKASAAFDATFLHICFTCYTISKFRTDLQKSKRFHLRLAGPEASEPFGVGLAPPRKDRARTVIAALQKTRSQPHTRAYTQGLLEYPRSAEESVGP